MSSIHVKMKHELPYFHTILYFFPLCTLRRFVKWDHCLHKHHVYAESLHLILYQSSSTLILNISSNSILSANTHCFHSLPHKIICHTIYGHKILKDSTICLSDDFLASSLSIHPISNCTMQDIPDHIFLPTLNYIYIGFTFAHHG